MLPRYKLRIDDVGGPRVRKLMTSLRDNSRLARYAGRRVQDVVGEHVLKIAQTRHTTSLRLGASPTGFLGDAYEVATSPRALSVRPGQAVLDLPHSGFARAFRDVTITATNSKYLTIPVNAASYGKRIRKGENSRFSGGFFFRSKKKNLLYAVRVGKGKDAQLIILYFLTPSVVQKQDRTLLPSDNEIKAAALKGALDFVDELIKAKGGQS